MLFSKEGRGRGAREGAAGDLGGELGSRARAVGAGLRMPGQRASVEAEKGVGCACDERAEREAVLWEVHFHYGSNLRSLVASKIGKL